MRINGPNHLGGVAAGGADGRADLGAPAPAGALGDEDRLHRRQVITAVMLVDSL